MSYPKNQELTYSCCCVFFLSLSLSLLSLSLSLFFRIILYEGCELSKSQEQKNTSPLQLDAAAAFLVSCFLQCAVLTGHDHHAAIPFAPPRKHNRLPDLEVVGLAQRGPPGAEPRMPLARRAERLVRDQPLAVLLVEYAYPPAKDDGVGLAARGRARRCSPRIFVVPRRRLAAGVVSVVREEVGGHGRVDVHAVEVRGA